MGDFPVVGAALEEDLREELLALGGLEETAVEGFMLFAFVEGETAAGEGRLRLGGMVGVLCRYKGVVLQKLVKCLGSQCKSLYIKRCRFSCKARAFIP